MALGFLDGDHRNTLSQLGYEFLRRVTNELKGRQFTQLLSSNLKVIDIVTAAAQNDIVLKVLPEMTREFAEKIKPAFTRCHVLLPPPEHIQHHFFAQHLDNGLSIRCLRYFDVIEGEFCYRFDAGFS